MIKQKILYIITKSNWGGAQRYVFDLATSLPKDKYEIKVAGGGIGGKNAEAGMLKERLEKQNVDFIFLPYLTRDISLLREVAVFFELLKLFKKEKPSIVHLNSSKIGGIGALAGRIAGVKKIIFTAHGFAFDEDRSFLQKFLIKFLSWGTVLLTTKTIVLMEKDKKRLEGWPFISKKIFMVRNGINIEEIFSKDEARAEIEKIGGTKIPENTFVIGSIGELHKNKGYEFALEALPKINFSFIYFIVGSGEEKENLEKIIQKNNLQGKVYLLGNILDAKRLIKAFDVFLLPSIKEGLPYVVLEAGISEVPVIATSVGGVAEIIENKKTGILINSKDPKDIKDAIEQMKNNPEESQKMALNMHKKMTENFSIEKMVSNTINTYISY